MDFKENTKLEKGLKRLRELKHSTDQERAHVEADRVLLDIIGDGRVTRAFNDIQKWYA